MARSHPRSDSPPVPFTAIPLTAYPGREQQPSFSPDGSSVAFSWNGETEDNWDIYVKLIGPGSPQRLTTDPAIEFSPAWSPDGRSIAFGRIRAGRMVVVVIPSRGGPEREVFESPRRSGLGIGQILSWSPDSRILVVTASPSADTPAILTAVDVATGERDRSRRRLPPGAMIRSRRCHRMARWSRLCGAAAARRASCTCRRCRLDSRRSVSLGASREQGVCITAWPGLQTDAT